MNQRTVLWLAGALVILALLAVFAVAASCGGAQEIRSLVDTVIPEPTASPVRVWGNSVRRTT